MKKMGFYKSGWLSLLARSLSLALFFCFAGLQSGQAQVVAKFAAGDTTCVAEKLDACNGDVTSSSTRFTDDGTNDGNYSDPVGHARRDTVEFCPKDQWHRVKVVFTDFDLAVDDTLFVFEGDKAAVRASGGLEAAGNPLGCGSGTGVGVAKAFGGWKDASCNPVLNPTGCLTFIFATDGDNNKGAGWDAWVDCEERDIDILDGSSQIQDKRLACGDVHGFVVVGSPIPVICGDTIFGPNNAFLVRIRNQQGELCLDGQVSFNGAAAGAPDWRGCFMGIGQYEAVYKWTGDTTKTLTRRFAVQAPSLVGNDEVNVPLGSACEVTLTPDDLLEQACDTIRDYMYYNITVTLGSGKDAQTLVTTGHDGLGAVTYPTITKAALKAAGVSACGGKASVKVERIYYGDRDGDGNPDFPALTKCNNGVQAVSTTTDLIFSDVDAPWVDVTAAPSTIIACGPEGLEKFFGGKGVDNCDDDITVEVKVTLDETDPCFASNGKADTTTATVVFTAVDDCGNVGTATRTVTIVRPDVQDPRFVVKTSNVKVECSADAATIPYPGVKTGPWNAAAGVFAATSTTDTTYLNDKEYICGYILVQSEETIPSTDCGKKKYIYWDALDWCTSTDGPKRMDTTFVEYVDETAPAFAAGEGAPVTIELDHFSCTYDVSKIGKPSATDNCDENPAVRLAKVSRIEDGGLWAIDAAGWAELDCDSFQLQWIVEDDCHEQLVNDTLTQIIEIKDVTKPSAACVDRLNVSVPNEWGARVYVDDIDAGSYDACGIASRLIRIKGSGDDFAEYVTIGCEYVHPDLQIEMLVTDKKGNSNLCWLDVTVEDKINPFCEPLADVTEDCEKYHAEELGASTDSNEDLEMSDDEWVALTGDLAAFYNGAFGNVDATVCEDNLAGSTCGALEYEQEYQLVKWPCGEAKVSRRYRAKDWSGNYSSWVTQTITITSTQNWKITFPGDWEGSCGDMAPAEQIVISNGACDLLGYEVTEKQFEVPGDACFKIERTYHVINWCKYVAGDEPVQLARVEGDHGVSEGLMVTNEGNEDAGYWTYIQVLKVHDDVAPVVTVIDPEPCINAVEFDALPYGEEDNTPGSAPYECDEIKTWSATATDCSSNISWTGKLYNAATGALVREVTSNEISHVVSNKETFYAEFWASDNCGNSAGERGADVKFWDCKKPTPYVLNGVAVELGESASVQVWATDLDQASFDNCTDQSQLEFRIWADFLGDAPTDLAGVEALGKVITFECDRVGNNLVHIYVIDEEKNWDYAQTYVIVQDNMDACGGNDASGMVAGTIVNPQGENVEAVAVTIAGATDESMTTGADGYFQFEMDMGADYTVTPVKDINPLNGVSTFDLVLISKHILGITQFDSPYKYVAADVNKSGTITAFDMVQLRQLILNIRTEFPSNDSWRFVDASHNFTSANPASENFGEFYTINTLNGDMMNLDFVGVKIGDVNGNAQANSLLGAESRTTNGALTLTAADRFVEAGETVTVAFTAADIASAQGYQFTMNFAGQNAEVVEGVAKAANFNTTIADRGVIATSWNGEATANDVLFSLTFNATATGLLSEMVSVSSDVTTAEAYNTAGELLDVDLAFTPAVAAGFELTQNTPNPFKAETVIGFNLPTAGNATLTVMDAQGKVLKSISADYAKGANQVTLKANELGATGVLYYQLESADNVATKKMIIIE